jgi:uncharacterized membrane protein YfcA
MNDVWWLGLFAALCIGLSKAGFSGVSMVAVVLLAELHGARESVGLALPLLVVADLLAYPAFRRHGSWSAVWPLLGPTLIGLGLGWWLLGRMDDAVARKVIGCSVMLMVLMQWTRKFAGSRVEEWLHTPALAVGVGLLGGFATMLANAAGPVIQLYLAARRIPKMELIGIAARFFLLVNLLKLPLNARLALITPDSLMENLRLLPGVVVGIYGGRWLVQKVPQSAFEWMITGFALLAALRLLIW